MAFNHPGRSLGQYSLLNFQLTLCHGVPSLSGHDWYELISIGVETVWEQLFKGAQMHSVYLKGDKQNASELQQVWFSALAHCLVNCKLRKTVKKVKSTVEKKAPKLRKNIQPGQILILLASKFRGKRVVFLKQLESGLLLVTGPFALNGVPLKRVNQRYCIATSTKVDLGGADFKSITDSYFAQEKTGKKGLKGQEKFFAAEAPKKVLPQEKKDGQKKTRWCNHQGSRQWPLVASKVVVNCLTTKEDKEGTIFRISSCWDSWCQIHRSMKKGVNFFRPSRVCPPTSHSCCWPSRPWTTRPKRCGKLKYNDICIYIYLYIYAYIPIF